MWRYRVGQTAPAGLQVQTDAPVHHTRLVNRIPGNQQGHADGCDGNTDHGNPGTAGTDDSAEKNCTEH